MPKTICTEFDLTVQLAKALNQLDAELKRANSSDTRLEYLVRKIEVLESFL